jgi:ankyrin repeat protein
MKIRTPFLVALGVAIVATIFAVVSSHRSHDSKPLDAVITPSLAVDVPEIGLVAYGGKVKELEHLLASGVNIESAGSDNRSPLVLAIAGGRTDAVAVLLKAGANANTIDIGGMTPAHWAAVRGNLEVARLLFARGSKLNGQAKYGETPLILAAMHGKGDILKFLVDAGADARIKDVDGSDALGWARKNRCSPFGNQLR